MPGFGTATAAHHLVAVWGWLSQCTHHLDVQMRKEARMFWLLCC